MVKFHRGLNIPICPAFGSSQPPRKMRRCSVTGLRVEGGALLYQGSADTNMKDWVEEIAI